jgi:hypothetical protein
MHGITVRNCGSRIITRRKDNEVCVCVCGLKYHVMEVLQMAWRKISTQSKLGKVR